MPTEKTSPPADLDARLAAANELLDADDEKRVAVQQLRELAIKELDVKLRAELGVRGEDFEIVDGGPEGPLAVKLGPTVLYKRWKDLVKREKDTDADLFSFVAPCVAFPDRETFAAIVGKRIHLLTKCGDALLRLYGGWEEKRQGKY